MRSIDTAYTRSMLAYANKIHTGQMRTSDGVPVIIHPYAVAALVTLHQELFAEQYVNAYVTALLHDVIEDTEVTYENVKEASGSKEIADAVMALTKDEVAGDDLAQLEDSLSRALAIGDWVVWVKVFDRIDNWNFALCPPARTDEEFRALFVEGDLIIETIKKTQDQGVILKLFTEVFDRYKRFSGLNK